MMGRHPGSASLPHLARQLSNLVEQGLSESEAMLRLEKTAPELFRRDMELIKRLTSANSESATATTTDSMHTLARLARTSREHGGDPLAILARTDTRTSSISHAYRIYWSSVAGFLFYIGALCIVATVLLAIYMIFVFPQLNKFYADMGATLPPLTRTLGSISSHFTVPTLSAGIVLVVALGIIGSNIGRSIQQLSPIPAWIGRIPGLRRTCRAFHELLTLDMAQLLIESGVAAETALREADKLVGHKLHNDPAATPRTARSTTGETVTMLDLAGRLGVLDQEIAYQSENAAQVFTRRISRVRSEFTIFAMALVGALIGLIVIGMYLPIFKMGSIV